LSALDRSYRFLTSKGLAVGLFAMLCIVVAPGTFRPTPYRTLAWPGSVILALMALNLVLCTLQRLRSLARPVLVIHAGAVVVIAGAVASSFGYVATANIYEGSAIDTAYRWDLGRDFPLGFELAVKRIHKEYYPIPVRVGVLRADEKVGLFELKTGGSFDLDRYRIRASYMEFPSENLRLDIFERGDMVGSVDTEGERRIPRDFPYDFVLVAFQDPKLKKAGVDLLISRNDAVLAEGRTEINSPLTWEKVSFYNTLLDKDEAGLPFAGLQITRDPGRPLVFAGFGIIGAGSVWYVIRRLRVQRSV